MGSFIYTGQGLLYQLERFPATITNSTFTTDDFCKLINDFDKYWYGINSSDTNSIRRTCGYLSNCPRKKHIKVQDTKLSPTIW